MSSDDSGGNKGSFPFDPSSFSRIRLEKNVSARAAQLLLYAIAGCFSMAAIFAFTGHPTMAFALCVIGVALAVGGGLYIFDFAKKNPGPALLEGAEFLKYFEAQQAAKDPNTIEGELVPTANATPPTAITGGSA